MDHLNKLENESIFILRQAYSSIKNISMLWSLGKDSNVMVWLAFKAFLGKIPFPVVHVDTKKKFKNSMVLSKKGVYLPCGPSQNLKSILYAIKVINKY